MIIKRLPSKASAAAHDTTVTNNLKLAGVT